MPTMTSCTLNEQTIDIDAAIDMGVALIHIKIKH